MDYSIEKKKPARAEKPEAATPGKKYTDEDIHALLSDGYLSINSGLWDHIPKGSHIRYVKKDNGAGTLRTERFKPGGFVRNHFTKNEKKMLIIENRPGGTAGSQGYISFPLAYEDIEELWKKYDRDAFIEVHLITASLAQKKKQIEDLTTRVSKLEDILRAVIRK